MGKILGSWSGMRKYLEQDMLANSLQGRNAVVLVQQNHGLGRFPPPQTVVR